MRKLSTFCMFLGLLLLSFLLYGFVSQKQEYAVQDAVKSLDFAILGKSQQLTKQSTIKNKPKLPTTTTKSLKKDTPKQKAGRKLNMKLMKRKRLFSPKTSLSEMALAAWRRASKNTKKVQLLLLCHWRGGSSFLSDVLQYYPSTFYTFEPFHRLNNVTFGSDEAHDILTNLFTCNYNKLQPMLDWMSIKSNQWLSQWNRHYWSVCSLSGSKKCFDPNFSSRVCNMSTLNLVKTVRIKLEQAKYLLEHPPKDTNIKVIHLVRDPRGMFASRVRAEKGYAKNWTDVQEMCEWFQENYITSLVLKAKFPDKYMQIRYEDFSRYPMKLSRKIMLFAGLEMHQRMVKHLQYSVKGREADSLNMYSTKRNSSSTWSNWTKKLKKDVIMKIQNTCAPYLSFMGYKTVSKDDYLDDFYPLMKDNIL